MSRVVMILRQAAYGVILASLLAACAAPQRLEGSGVIAPPPLGWLVACANNPAMEGCPK